MIASRMAKKVAGGWNFVKKSARLSINSVDVRHLDLEVFDTLSNEEVSARNVFDPLLVLRIVR